MPDVPSPADLEREIEDTRERLAATLDLLVDKTHPKKVARRQADNVQSTARLLLSGEPQVVHRSDGTVVVRQLRTDRAAAAAGGGLTLLVLTLWARRRRRRRDTRPELVQAAERSLVEARATGRKAAGAVAKQADKATVRSRRATRKAQQAAAQAQQATRRSAKKKTKKAKKKVRR